MNRGVFWLLVAVALLAWTVIFIAAGHKDIAGIFLYMSLISIVVGEAHHIKAAWDDMKDDLATAYRWFWRL